MKVLVFGSNGWIGGQFVNILQNSGTEYKSATCRADDYDGILKEIESYQPTNIVSFIGRTHGKIGDKVYTTIDYLEQEGKLVENVRDNLYSPLLLAEISKTKKIHYTYLGTGCIFKFDEDHPFGKEENGFDEESEPNFFGSSYSVVKGFTDKFMHLYEDYVLNLRIRMPITGEKNGRNFITKIVTYEKVCSVPNSMTVLPELLPMVLELMKKKTTGTLNLTNPGLISHNEILEMYKEIVDPKFVWKNFSQEEQRAILAADRSNNFLETTKLEFYFPHVKNIKDSVREMLFQYKQTLPPIENVVCELSEINEVPEDAVNLLITGGCGFIGSNFINYYFPKQGANFNLINLDALYYCADLNNVDKTIQNNKNYVFVKGNLCNSNLITKLLHTSFILLHKVMFKILLKILYNIHMITFLEHILY